MCNNSTAYNCSFPLRTGMFDVGYHLALIFIGILIIVSNSLVIALFVTKETLRKGGKLLLLSLAVSDFTTGLLTIPLNIWCEMTFSLPVCMVSGSLNRFLAISTVYHILAITFETYYAILRPMEHHVKIEKHNILLLVAAVWTSATVIAVVPLSWAVGKLSSVTEKPSASFLRKMVIYEIFVILLGFFIPLTSMIFAHARMFLKIIRALKVLRKRSSPSHNSEQVAKKSSKYKTAMLFALILLVFVACWLFWFVVSLLKAMRKVKYPFPRWALNSLTIVRYCTSFINPLLYTFFRSDIFAAFKSFLGKRRSRRSSISLSYLLNGSARWKRDSQTTTTMIKEPNAVATPPIVSAPRNSSPKPELETNV